MKQQFSDQLQIKDNTNNVITMSDITFTYKRLESINDNGIILKFIDCIVIKDDNPKVEHRDTNKYYKSIEYPIVYNTIWFK